MPITDITFDGVNQFTEAVAAPVVEVKRVWADAWQAAPYIYCKSLRLGTGERMSQAALEYESGLMQRGATDPATEARRNLDRWLVRITCAMASPDAASVVWHGVIVSTVNHALGQANDDGILDGSGDPILDSADNPITGSVTAWNQEYTVFGLEWFLSRLWINRSIIDTGSGTTKTIGRPLVFNAGSHERGVTNKAVIGNRAASAALFVGDSAIASAAKWTAHDILDYLVTRFGPTDPPFVMSYDSAAALSWLTPNDLRVGPTVFDAINQVCSPRRGLTWRVRVPADELTAVVDVFSFATGDISLPGGGTMPENQSQVAVYTSQMRDAGVVEVQDTSRQFNQVIIYGARRGSCFTMTFSDALSAGWTSTQEAAYINAGTAVTPPRELKKQADTERTSDALSSVFQRFAMSSSWNGYVNTSQPVCPGITSGGDPILGPVDMWTPGLRVRPWIPLREGCDYSSSATSPTNSNPTGFVSQMRSPFVAYALGDGKYVRGERAAALARDEKFGQNGISFSASVTPLQEQCGVRVSTSAPAHVHARDWIAASHDAAAFDLTTDVAREMDFQSMKVTALVEFDERVKGVWPATPTTGSLGLDWTLEIDVGERARLDYLVPGTVLDVGAAGDLVTAASGGFVRDDRQWLQDVARVAWIWYSNFRVSLSITVHHLTSELSPGDLVRSHDGRPSDSMVTYVTYDFENGSTSISTDFAEVDPVGMVA